MAEQLIEQKLESLRWIPEHHGSPRAHDALYAAK